MGPVIRIVIHSSVITALNLLTALLTSSLLKILNLNWQIVFQALVAAILCIIIFLIWNSLVERLLGVRFLLRGRSEFGWTYFLPFVFSMLPFIGWNCLFREHITTLNDLLGMWLFQAVVNYVLLFIVYMGAIFDDRSLRG